MSKHKDAPEESPVLATPAPAPPAPVKPAPVAPQSTTIDLTGNSKRAAEVLHQLEVCCRSGAPVVGSLVTTNDKLTITLEIGK